MPEFIVSLLSACWWWYLAISANSTVMCPYHCCCYGVQRVAVADIVTMTLLVNTMNQGWEWCFRKIAEKLTSSIKNSPFRVKYGLFTHFWRVLKLVIEDKNSGNPLNSEKFSSLMNKKRAYCYFSTVNMIFNVYLYSLGKSRPILRVIALHF